MRQFLCWGKQKLNTKYVSIFYKLDISIEVTVLFSVWKKFCNLPMKVWCWLQTGCCSQALRGWTLAVHGSRDLIAASVLALSDLHHSIWTCWCAPMENVVLFRTSNKFNWVKRYFNLFRIMIFINIMVKSNYGKCFCYGFLWLCNWINIYSSFDGCVSI